MKITGKFENITPRSLQSSSHSSLIGEYPSRQNRPSENRTEPTQYPKKGNQTNLQTGRHPYREAQTKTEAERKPKRKRIGQPDKQRNCRQQHGSAQGEQTKTEPGRPKPIAKTSMRTRSEEEDQKPQQPKQQTARERDPKKTLTN
ncbi:hypothetical protein NDU88_006071 [Pleurodeles waltl]|uniref:Uncharacterized protein n=1 Tax=Pleurodeles waltl TaxID=8319 RepID=A0AAV7VPH2_PLEWA|nr:hypothetical protein NDU88_006071 [Pleurodeles waltl]